MYIADDQAHQYQTSTATTQDTKAFLQRHSMAGGRSCCAAREEDRRRQVRHRPSLSLSQICLRMARAELVVLSFPALINTHAFRSVNPRHLLLYFL